MLKKLINTIEKEFCQEKRNNHLKVNDQTFYLKVT